MKIKIVKPTDAATFADLAGDPLEYRAMALKDMGVYGGRQIAGQLCFAPDETVSRGEFLVMAMRVLGMEPDAAVLTSGFADEAATAAWMRPISRPPIAAASSPASARRRAWSSDPMPRSPRQNVP